MATPDILELPGLRAELLAGYGTNGGFSLVVDGVTQSHVNPDDSRDLQLPYVRQIAAVLAEIGSSAPIAVLHLGAGALTLPRYVASARPGSRQRVVELHGELLAFVVARLPLPATANIELVVGDAREEVERLLAADDSGWHAVIVDVFAADAVPAHVTTVEFFAELRALLAPGGVVIVNCYTASDLAIARDTAAALASLQSDVLVVASEAVVLGAIRGNAVVVGGSGTLDTDAIRRKLDDDAQPVEVIAHAQPFGVAGRLRHDDDER